jgi:hypothetical protein
LDLGIRRSPTFGDELLETLSTWTDQGAVELILNKDSSGDLLVDGVGNSKDRRFSRCNAFLAAANGDGRDGLSILGAFDVDMSICLVLDLVDRNTTFTEDAGNCAVGNGEVETVVVLLFEFDGLSE